MVPVAEREISPVHESSSVRGVMRVVRLVREAYDMTASEA